MNWRMQPFITEFIWTVIPANIDGGEPKCSASQKQRGQSRTDWRPVTLIEMGSDIGFNYTLSTVS